MKLELEIEGHIRQVTIDPADSPNTWRVAIDGQELKTDACLLRPGVLSLLIDGQSHRIILESHPTEAALYLGTQRVPFSVGDPRSLRFRRRHSGTDGPAILRTSMPGRVVRVLVEPGQAVAAHQPILVVEAMKMQNELKAPKEGRIADLRVAPGHTVATGDVLAVIE